MKGRMYRTTAFKARADNIPIVFEAAILKETVKAFYLYGHGVMDPLGRCARCGRTLTHPGSILIGIGPECLGDWGMRDAVLSNMTAEQAERLRMLVTSRIIDGWFPKSTLCIEDPAPVEVAVPVNHPMLTAADKCVVIGKKAEMIRFADNGKLAVKLVFGFDRELITKVKTLPGRKYHDEGYAKKYWTAPLGIETVQKLKEWGFALDAELEATLTKIVNGAFAKGIDTMTDIEVPGLLMELFPFQKKGVAFIESRGGRALLGDEMGLGKTAQALAWCQLHTEKRPVIIVCPASLKLNWEREIRMWLGAGPQVQILSGKKPSAPLYGEYIIINYDVLSAWVKVLRKISPKVVVTDECHYYKNRAAQRTKAVKGLVAGVPHLIAISGTPIVNRPIEGFNALQFIDEMVVPSFWDYARRYCGAKNNGFGWDFTGATNTEELHKRLTETIMIRRKKSDVMKDLPEKLYTFLPMALDNESTYRAAEQDFISYVCKTKGAEAARRAGQAEQLAQVEALKQLSATGKLAAAMQWIENFIDSDGKLVVFAVHKMVVDALMETFKDKAVKVDGSVTGPARDAAVQAFQNDDRVRVFIGNIRAAGVGITLTAASNVAFLELPWTPGELVQAEDRCHRIGQKNAVNIYYLMAAGTIDERIARMLDRKKKVLDSVLDGKSMEDTGSVFAELLASYEEEV